MLRSARSSAPSRARFAVGLTLGLAVTLGACGGDDDSGTDDIAVTTEVDDSSDGDSTAEGNGTGTDGGDEVDALIARADSSDDQSTPSGGRIVLAVECAPVTGGNVLSVAGTGLPGGVYEPEIEPSIGVTFAVQVLPDGTAIGASQTTLDEPSYTVTFADLDGGVTLTVDGCA